MDLAVLETKEQQALGMRKTVGSALGACHVRTLNRRLVNGAVDAAQASGAKHQHASMTVRIPSLGCLLSCVCGHHSKRETRSPFSDVNVNVNASPRRQHVLLSRYTT